MKKIILALLIITLSSSFLFADEDYSFDEKEFLNEIEKKPYRFGGFVELRPVESWLNKEGSLYKLNYYDSDVNYRTEEYNGSVKADGSIEYGLFAAYAKGSIEGWRDYRGNDWDATLYEGYASFAPSDFFRLNAGKESLKWGKGYAWNPTAFVTRPKNTDDPELDLEGYYLARFEFIKSFSDPLKTVSFTPVFIPVSDDINDDYAKDQDYEAAAKIYLLFFDTDLDFVYSYGKTNKSRYGFGFSRNILSNIEIHGEAAYLTNVQKAEVTGSNTLKMQSSNAGVYLAGVRYLNEHDTTFIVEYFYNSAGRNEEVMKVFYTNIDDAYDYYNSTGDSTRLNKIKSGGGSNSQSNPMINYSYIRISQKDPFDILYLTPAITWIFNIDDKSFSLSPEIAYNGITNLDIRLKANFLFGNEYSEFGEKPFCAKAELRLRYSF
ncbi:MAG: hypothetical protein JXN64_06830 [Spirochaetes bacterium]|nr:hypothetical protein [Spirochaetota bacterium]